jgi:hypothetical protein
VPRRPKTAPVWPSWYGQRLQAADGQLVGTWWRCRRHGLTVDPLTLGGCAVPYCPNSSCVEVLLLVSKLSRTVEDEHVGVWRRLALGGL